jgi:hypothetical protein
VTALNVVVYNNLKKVVVFISTFHLIVLIFNLAWPPVGDDAERQDES